MVNDGRLDISFSASVGEPIVSAIEFYLNEVQKPDLEEEEKIIVSESLPETFALHQNFPNPFNASTKVRFQIPEDCEVSLKIYNTLGQEIVTLMRGFVPAGYHVVNWNGQNDHGYNQESGIYLFQLRAGGYTETRKMLMLK